MSLLRLFSLCLREASVNVFLVRCLRPVDVRVKAPLAVAVAAAEARVCVRRGDPLPDTPTACDLLKLSVTALSATSF